MKTSEIKEGKTYQNAGGFRRMVIKIIEIGHGSRLVRFQCKEKVSCVLTGTIKLSSFAAWATEEVK
jgi:hypothetical protein